MSPRTISILFKTDDVGGMWDLSISVPVLIICIFILLSFFAVGKNKISNYYILSHSM